MKITPSKVIIVALLGLALVFGQVLQSPVGQMDELAFQPVGNLPGWRRVTFDAVTLPGGSATGAVFLGIGNEASAEPLSSDGLCDFLYGRKGQGVPAAFFTDVNCPNCRSLELKLDARRDRLNHKRIDLPLLGQQSENWARFMIAVDLQKGSAKFAEQALPSGPTIISRAMTRAARAGLDASRIERDMTGPDVDDRLTANFAAADTLGIWGTPALTIGSTLVMGDMDGEVLDRLIALEAARDDGAC